MSKFIDKYAKPFFFTGGKEACLLIHGFTGSPGHMRYLGEFLKEKGYTVSAPLLPGHGTSLSDMEQTDWNDWLTAVEKEYQKLANEYDGVYVMGLSMGGILSLLLAERYDVEKVISIAAPVKIKDWRAHLAPILKYFKRYNNWDDEAQEKDKYDVGYSATPVKTVPSLLKLMKLAKNNFGKIKAPALIVQSHDDQTVKPVSAKMIYENISSSKKDIMWLNNSGHVCTIGPEKEAMQQGILSFLQE